MNKSFLQSFLQIFALSLCVCAIIFIDSNPQKNIPTALLMPPKDIKYFALGYNEVLADILWLRSLQDIDLCGDANLIPDTKELTDGPGKIVTKCENGWSFRMLDTVTELAPKFNMPYKAGAAILSFIAHDSYGAGILYKKGVERFPNDWEMQYRAAYHYMAALHDLEQASKYLIQAGKNGAPAWVFALAARLQTKLGRAVLAKPILEEAIAADPEGRYVDRLKERLNEINRTIQKGDAAETEPESAQ